MELDYNGVGNHEFDEGVDELLRMQYGNRRGGGRDDGCHPVDGCLDGDGFAGASFDFLAANVKYKSSGKTIFPPYRVHTFKSGAKVALIGMTLEGTPSIVAPAGISHVDFLDEAETVNALVPELQRRGVRTIVVLPHEGGTVSAPGNGAGSETAINQCTNPSGPLPPIVEAMHPEVDVHRHRPHELGRQLRDRRQDRHRGRRHRPARHRHRPDDRPRHRRRRRG